MTLRGRSFRWPAVLGLVGATLLATSDQASAGGKGGPLQIRARVSNRLDVVMSVRRRVWPRNSLVQVTLVVHNNTHRTIGVRNTCVLIPVDAFVENGAHHEVYPPAIYTSDSLGPFGCVPRITTPIRPGSRFTHRQYVILRGRYILGDFDGETLAPAIRVALRPVSGRPRLQLVTAPHLGIQVIPPSGVHGGFQYVDEVKCYSAGPPGATPGYSFGGHMLWTPSHSLTLTPRLPYECTSLDTWHIVVGWPGHSVATLDYSRPVT